MCGSIYKSVMPTPFSNASGKNLFVPELIDIITPASPSLLSATSPSSRGQHSQSTQPSSEEEHKFPNADFKRPSAGAVDISQICLVMEYMDSDMHLLLQRRMDYAEEHLMFTVYNSLCALAFMH